MYIPERGGLSRDSRSADPSRWRYPESRHLLIHGGYHADLNETYYVGDRAKTDPDSARVVETTRECLDMAVKLVKPGTLFRDFGKVIEKHAKSRNCSVHA